jgi:hypothetical protein
MSKAQMQILAVHGEMDILQATFILSENEVGSDAKSY